MVCTVRPHEVSPPYPVPGARLDVQAFGRCQLLDAENDPTDPVLFFGQVEEVRAERSCFP